MSRRLQRTRGTAACCCCIGSRPATSADESCTVAQACQQRRREQGSGEPQERGWLRSAAAAAWLSCRQLGKLTPLTAAMPPLSNAARPDRLPAPHPLLPTSCASSDAVDGLNCGPPLLPYRCQPPLAEGVNRQRKRFSFGFPAFHQLDFYRSSARHAPQWPQGGERRAVLRQGLLEGVPEPASGYLSCHTNVFWAPRACGESCLGLH